MKDAYEDLDVDDLVDLLKEARAKLRFLVAKKGVVDDGYFDIVNRLIKRIDNTLPSVYRVRETVTTVYETEVEAKDEDDARYIYSNGASDDREEIEQDSGIEVEEV